MIPSIRYKTSPERRRQTKTTSVAAKSERRIVWPGHPIIVWTASHADSCQRIRSNFDQPLHGQLDPWSFSLANWLFTHRVLHLWTVFARRYSSMKD